MPSIRSTKKDKSRLYVIGVYFLFQADEVVYVGKSENIFSRIQTHFAQGDKLFDSWAYREYPVEKIGRAESKFIRLLRPKYNKVNNPYYYFDNAPFANTRPRGLVAYYSKLHSAVDVKLEFHMDDKSVYVGMWNGEAVGNTFETIWSKTFLTKGAIDEVSALGEKRIKLAVQVLRTIHPLVRKLYLEGWTISEIGKKLAVSDLLIDRLLKVVILPEIQWWKHTEIDGESITEAVQ